MPVHGSCSDREADLWLEPEIELARKIGLSRTQLKQIESIVEVQHDNLCRARRDDCRR